MATAKTKNAPSSTTSSGITGQPVGWMYGIHSRVAAAGTRRSASGSRRRPRPENATTKLAR